MNMTFFIIRGSLFGASPTGKDWPFGKIRGIDIKDSLSISKPMAKASLVIKTGISY
jgi:hypothetical protein